MLMMCTGETTDLTEDNRAMISSHPSTSKDQMAWLQMKRDGYETDKQDL